MIRSICHSFLSPATRFALVLLLLLFFEVGVAADSLPQQKGFFSLDTIQVMRDIIVFVIMACWMFELLEIPFRWAYAVNPIPVSASPFFCALFVILGLFLSCAHQKVQKNPKK